MRKNIIRLIMVIIVLVIIYNVYNITVEKLTQEQIYTFELEKEPKSTVLKLDKDNSVQIEEHKVNYVELPAGVWRVDGHCITTESNSDSGASGLTKLSFGALPVL